MEMLFVPAGLFIMGSADEDLKAGEDERPQHLVFLDKFWIDKTEVTNEMYARCVQAGACRLPAKTSSRTRGAYYGNPTFRDYPVVYLSWDEARTYCSWAGRRLPTEAEWEKAARGTDARPYPWGVESPDIHLLNYNNQVGDTTAVGTFPAGASPYGGLDMAGNVAEWVADWYSADYYLTSPVSNPLGPIVGTYRVLRGGSWFNLAGAVRAAYRIWNYPEQRFDGAGFRCAQ
jgi:serine/threonine-protein kinase